MCSYDIERYRLTSTPPPRRKVSSFFMWRAPACEFERFLTDMSSKNMEITLIFPKNLLEEKVPFQFCLDLYSDEYSLFTLEMHAWLLENGYSDDVND